MKLSCLMDVYDVQVEFEYKFSLLFKVKNTFSLVAEEKHS